MPYPRKTTHTLRGDAVATSAVQSSGNQVTMPSSSSTEQQTSYERSKRGFVQTESARRVPSAPSTQFCDWNSCSSIVSKQHSQQSLLQNLLTREEFQNEHFMVSPSGRRHRVESIAEAGRSTPNTIMLSIQSSRNPRTNVNNRTDLLSKSNGLNENEQADPKTDFHSVTHTKSVSCQPLKLLKSSPFQSNDDLPSMDAHVKRPYSDPFLSPATSACASNSYTCPKHPSTEPVVPLVPDGCLTGHPNTSIPKLEPRFGPPQQYIRNRRTAVSSEPVSMESINDWKPPVHSKTEEEAGRISQVISTKLDVLFGHLSEENEQRVVSAMFKKSVLKGTVLIEQGDEGDNFYIIDEGKFDIYVTRNGKQTNKVLEATQGMSFGELALMYNAPRAATCIAVEDSVVWALDRRSFRMLLVTAENTKKKQYESLLERIEIFKCLTKYERSQLSDILAVQECKEGECVIKQGDRGDKFYIVESGELVCKMKQDDDSPELEVHCYRRGGYFGELALIMKYGIRKASVYSVGNDTRLLWIGKSKFDRVLGPIIDILRKNANLYPTYAQLLSNSQ